MAVLFALIAFFGWATGDIIIAKISRKIGSIVTLFWLLFLGTILLAFYIPFAPRVTDFSMLIFATVIGLLDIIGALYYFKAFEEGNVSIVGTIGNSFVIVTAIASIIIFRENLHNFQYVGIVAASLGLILTSMDFNLIRDKKHRGIISDKTVLYALLAMVCWAIYFTVIRIPVERIGWFWASYPTYWFFVIFLFHKKIYKSFSQVFRQVKTTVSVFTYTILVTVAFFSFNIGLTYGYTSVVAPIAGSFPVLFVILSRFIFREQLTVQQKVGIVSTLTGIVMIASFSG